MLADAEVFLVKLWTEPRELVGADPLWRGSATNLATGETRYFQSLDELAQHLAHTSGFPLAV